MNLSTLVLTADSRRVFTSLLLAFSILITPIAAMAAKPRTGAATEATGNQSAPANESAKASAKDVFPNLPAPALPVGSVTATMTGTITTDADSDTKADPGVDTVTYSTTITNNTGADISGLQFTDTVDPHTTIIAGSAVSVGDDAYRTIGNVNINVPLGTGVLANDFNPNTGNNTGITVSSYGATTGLEQTSVGSQTTTAQGGSLTVQSDGSFTYDPPLGFNGPSDSFKYASNQGGTKAIATVRITISSRMWFVKNSGAAGGACSSICDGRLSHPFQTLAALQAVNGDAAGGHPQNGDSIFVYESTTDYVGPINLRSAQKFIGQDATATIETTTGLSTPSGSTVLPAMNATQATITNITASNANAINLGIDNTLRGFAVGNVGTGTKISGTSFGTLTVGNNSTPDVTLNGTGQALSLSTGAFVATSGFVSVASTSSGAQGINLSGIAGAVAFGSTSVSGSTTQGILVGTTTAAINFGNTSVTGGTDAISLQNNSSGTRTFGTISVTTPSAAGFLHAAGGGLVAAAVTTITNPGSTGIDIQNSTTLVNFGATTVNKSSTAGTGVNLATNSGGTTFSSLAVTTSNGAGLTTNSAGTVTVSAAAGSSISATGLGSTVAPALSAASTTFSAAFTSLASTNSGGAGTGITLTGDGGTLTSTTTNIQNPAGAGITVGTSAAASSFDFGNTTVNGSGSTGVSLASNVGAVTFADLDISPDSGQRALLATNNTGTITSTSGDIAATSNVTLEITGASAVARTPLVMVLNNVDSTNSTGLGVNLNFVSGNLTVSDPGVATNITNAAGVGIQVQNTAASGTMNFGNTTVSGSGGTGVVLGTASNGNAGNITFAALNISPDSGQRALNAQQNTGAIASTSGAVVTTNNTAVEIQGVSAGSRTPLNMQLTSINTPGGSAAPNGILLKFTSATGAPGGFGVLGSGGSCDAGTATCTGGRITATSGGDGATSGNGVYLENADKVSLTRMHIDNHPNFAVRGFNGAGFTMNTCLVDGTNGNNAAFFEGSVIFDNLTGTAGGSNAASITASTIKGGWGDNVRFANTSGALEVTISNSTIRDTNTGTNGNDNVHFDVHTTANVTAHITGSNFAATNGDHIQTICDGQASLAIVVGGSPANANTLSGGGGVNALGQGITISGGDIQGSTDSTETVRFNISNNTMNGTIQGGAININEGVGNGNWQGQVSNNTIGTAATPGSGASQSSDIRVENHAKGTLTAIVNGNTLHQYSVEGITLSAGDTSATGLTNGPLNVTVTSNTISNPNNNPPTSVPDHGISLNAGTQIGNTNQVCLDLKNNNSAGNPPQGGVDYRLRQRMLTTVFLPGYGGAATDTTAVDAYVLARPNTASGSGTVAAAAAGTGGGYQNGGAQCTQPIVVTENLLNNRKQDTYFALNNSLLGGVDQFISRDNAVSLSQLERGIDIPVGGNFAVAATSMPSGVYSTAEGTRSTSFVSSFGIQGIANSISQPARSVDSIIEPTVYAAEKATGQKSELRDQRADIRLNHARNSKLVPRNSKLSSTMTPFAACSPAGINGGGTAICVDVPTIHNGDSITITFQATVNNPPNLTGVPPGIAQVTNFGTVTGPFTGSPLNTNTINTPVDRFNSTTTLGSNLNPANQGDSITFTATVAINGSQSPTPPSPLSPTGMVTFKSDNVAIGTCTSVALTLGGSGTATAQCTINTLTSPSHNMAADYSGDGNYDPSTSNIVSQTVNSCLTNPVVTNTNDSGAGSLRDAITNVCGTPNNTITFNIPNADPNHSGGVYTITLSTGEIAIANDVSITGPNSVTNTDAIKISGNSASRVFNINPGKTTKISNVTITGGSATGSFPANSGGAIINDHGTLTIVNSTITGNTAASGGGVFNNAIASGSASLTIINSTIGGNNATEGGGIYTYGDGGTATLNVLNSTLCENTAAGNGGGLTAFVVNSGGAPTNLVNVTISGNTAQLNGGGMENNGAVVSVINATITNNHSDNDNNASGAGGGIHTNVNALTLNNTIVAGNFVGSANTTADDVSGTVDSASSFNLIGTGGTGGLQDLVNSNQVGVASPGLGSLANNGGPTMTHALLPASPAIEKGSNPNLPADTFDLDNDANTAEGLPVDQRGVGYPRVADSAGPDTTQTVDIGAFELHPSVEDITDKTMAEDTLFNFNFNIGDGTGALITSVTATSGNTTLIPNANLSVTGSGSSRNLGITPTADANSPSNGTATITVTVTATNGRTATDTFVVTVTDVNDAPVSASDSIGAIDEDCGSGCTAGKYIIPFATLLGNDTNKGAANESGQTLTITGVSSPTGGMVAINGTNVEFTPTADYNGPAGFTYTATDNGTTNGLPDPKSGNATVSFTINAINDPPSFTKGADHTVTEDAGAQSVSNWATNMSPGPANESLQTVSFNITGNTNSALFSVQPAVSPSGTLTYTPAANAFGSATITLTAQDTGGTASGGQDTSAPQTFAINVTAVADTPTVTPNPASTNEDTQTGALGISRNAADTAEVMHFKITNIQHGTLFQSNGTTPINSGDFITFAQGNAGLKFTPSADYNSAIAGPAGFDVQASTSSSNTGLGGAVVTEVINVAAVNDAPSYTKGPDQSVPINAGAQTVNSWATDLTKGPVTATDETGQTLTFNVTGNTNAGLFSSGPAVDSSGNLTYIPAANTSGSATITLTLSDSGSNVSPNVNSSSQQTFTISVSCGASNVVKNTNDAGADSLRSAIATACAGDTVRFSNTTAGGATNFSDGSPRSINLTSGELAVAKNLTIIGPDANLLTINGSGPNRVFNITSGIVTFSKLKISGGAVTSGNNGGGVLNAGTLTLINATVSANTAGNQGGGIYNSGTLTLVNTTVSGNTGRLSGGGIYTTGSVTLINTTISGNNSNGNGGGLYFNGSTLASTNVTVTNNRSDNDNSGAETGGGTFRNGGTIMLKNTIVAGNFRGTGTTRDDVSGDLDATGSFNLIGDGTNMSGLTNGTSNNQVGSSVSPINAMLGSLGSNGGATQTHLLLPGSPAINAGSNALLPTDTFDLDADSDAAEPVPVDQRGAGFNRVVNTTVDIGAVEVNYTITASQGTPQSGTINTAFGTALQATVKESGNNQNGITVTFTPPGSGASGAFTGGNPATASTNGSGVATAPTFTANGTAGGPYSVVSSLAGNHGLGNFALTNTKANQTIMVNTHAPANAVFNATFTVTATASSGLGVVYSSAGACTNVGATFTMTSGAGACAVMYNHPGDANYNAAPQVSESVNAQRANQTITVNTHAAANAIYNTQFTVAATSGSGLPVNYSSGGSCTNVGATFTMTSGTGTCPVKYDQDGNGNFNAAPQVTESVSAQKASQTITFGALSNKNFGDADFNVSATASSNLTVNLTASGQCTLSTNTVHLTSAGSCTITAKQAGDANFNPAADVPQSFNIGKATSTTALSSSLNPSNLGQTVTFTATVSGPANTGTATGAIIFKDGANAISCTNAGGQTLNAGGIATCQISALTAGTHIITADYSGDTNFNISTGALAPNQVVNNLVLVSFSSSTYTVNEADGFVHVILNRVGDTSAAFNVDYATNDTGASNNCGALNTNLASSKCDYTTFLGTLEFVPGHTSMALDIPINQDSYAEGPESFTVNLSNTTGSAALVVPSSATITISDSTAPAGTTNAIDDNTVFVRQQYHDFLNREPDAPGLAFWVNGLNQCNDPAQRSAGQTQAQCLEVGRILTSAAFFLSIEFMQTGTFVRSFYVAALNRPNPPSAASATDNMPAFTEWLRDTQAVQRGVIVGQGSWQTTLDANRLAFMQDFVTRAEFVGLYPTTDTPTQYINKLYQHALNRAPSSTELSNGVGLFSSATTASDPTARGQALQKVTQTSDFISREMPRTFVQMEYFGYLRRNPNDPPDNNFVGYNFWLNKLNQFNGDFLAAEMVKAFFSSTEYRKRFGP
jgi:hypothetical protein